MACRCGKVNHPTRAAALEAQKRLVYDNHRKGRDEMSARLNVYPCPSGCAWHVGRAELGPSVYHYTDTSAFEAIADRGALKPAAPRRFSKRARRRHTGAILALCVSAHEPCPLVWFSWSDWDPRSGSVPHPGNFVSRPVAPDEGLVRLAAPAYVAKLRWSDYVSLNHTVRGQREWITSRGNPADWLATDRPVPLAAIRSITTWSGDAWVDVGAYYNVDT